MGRKCAERASGCLPVFPGLRARAPGSPRAGVTESAGVVSPAGLQVSPEVWWEWRVQGQARACSGAGFSLPGRKVLARAVTEQLSSAHGRLPDLGPCFHLLKLRGLTDLRASQSCSLRQSSGQQALLRSEDNSCLPQRTRNYRKSIVTEWHVGRAQARGTKGPWSRPGASPCSRHSTALGSGDAPAPWPLYRRPPAISRPRSGPRADRLGDSQGFPTPKKTVFV